LNVPPDGAVPAEVRRLLRLERERTLARITALTRDFEDIVERSSDASRDDEHDPEGATIAFERAQVSALLAAARAKLLDLEAAEQRLRHGGHTTCEGCGGPIPEERRLARPSTRTCVSCAR
jgi:DnaK suppressor protein